MTKIGLGIFNIGLQNGLEEAMAICGEVEPVLWLALGGSNKKAGFNVGKKGSLTACLPMWMMSGALGLPLFWMGHSSVRSKDTLHRSS